MRAVLILLLPACLAAAPGAFAAGPSFNCANARDDVEQAICADSKLSALDREVGAAYVAARGRLKEPALQKALLADQRIWLSARDWSMAPGGVGLASLMESRIAALKRVSAPHSSIVGSWISAAGGVDVQTAEGGSMQISIRTVEMTRGAWMCELEGSGSGSNQVTLVSPDLEGWAVRLSLVGQLLKIEEMRPADAESGLRPYCGVNGEVKGVYLPAAPQPHPSR